MPIGLVTDEEFEAELARYNRIKPIPKVVPSTVPGRKEGDVNVPDSLRKIIGETSVVEGRASAVQLASEFGISASSVSAYARGATSTKTYDSPKLDNVKFLNKSRARAVKKASKTLNNALSSISQEKLDYADAKDLAGIAKDMSVIIKNLEPQPEPGSSGQSQQQFVIFAPQFKKEEQFDVIQVTE